MPKEELPPETFTGASSADREQLGTTFGQVPELYDRARPPYPQQIFEDLVQLAGLRQGARVVEVGPGTGRGTSELAKRGLRITGVELSGDLAEIARRKLAQYSSVEIMTANFEEWQPARADFDAVIAITAFHWLDPQIRYAKSARLLRKGGSLAVAATRHVLPEDVDPFWIEVQEDYDAVVPGESNQPPPSPDMVGDLSDEIEASEFFRNVGPRRYVWDVAYTADEYIDLLTTASGHRALEPAKRDELFRRIRARIEARPEPVVTKTHLTTLNVARRL